MIVLHRTHPDPFADEAEERLRDLVVAHKVRSEPKSGGDGAGAPAADERVRVTDGGRTWRGRVAVAEFLDELEAEVRLGRQFQSDACYLDPDDPTRCL